MTGYRADDLIVSPFAALLTPEGAREAATRMEAVRAGRDVESLFETQLVRKDGTMIWVRETARAMPIKQQPILLIVCEDVSERRQAQHLTQQWFDLRRSYKRYTVNHPKPSSGFAFLLGRH